MRLELMAIPLDHKEAFVTKEEVDTCKSLNDGWITIDEKAFQTRDQLLRNMQYLKIRANVYRLCVTFHSHDRIISGTDIEHSHKKHKGLPRPLSHFRRCSHMQSKT